MASTYLSLHYHIVFGTKDRMPLIDSTWRSRLHEYLGGTIHGLGGVPEAVGTTLWVHENTELGDKFAWQNGYAAFSISATSRKAVREYIGNQEEHHRTKSFREEWIAMLDKAGIAYDPRFLD